MGMYWIELNAALQVETEAESEDDAKCCIAEMLDEVSEIYGIDFKYRFLLVVDRDDE